MPATDPRSDPRSDPAPAERDAALGMTIDESARRVGSIVWAERRLFELLGGWVPSTPEPPVKLALARRSRHHAAHAATLDVVLPDTRDHDPRALVAAADPEDPARFAELAALTGTDARLAALVDDLLPQRLEACEAFLAIGLRGPGRSRRPGTDPRPRRGAGRAHRPACASSGPRLSAGRVTGPLACGIRCRAPALYRYDDRSPAVGGPPAACGKTGLTDHLWYGGERPQIPS